MKNHPAYMTRIRIVRKERGFTLRELAAAIGTTPQTVQRLETDNMSISMDWLYKIAAVLEVTPASLVTGGTQPATPEDAMIEMFRAELFRTRRSPRDKAALLLIEASGQFATMLLEADQRPRQDVTRAAATVAACAIRIALDGEPQVAQPPLALVREAG